VIISTSNIVPAGTSIVRFSAYVDGVLGAFDEPIEPEEPLRGFVEDLLLVLGSVAP
jgi:hypothetical protein